MLCAPRRLYRLHAYNVALRKGRAAQGAKEEIEGRCVLSSGASRRGVPCGDVVLECLGGMSLD